MMTEIEALQLALDELDHSHQNSHAEDQIIFGEAIDKLLKIKKRLWRAKHKKQRNRVVEMIEYSEGIADDGAAILKDGEPMTPTRIISKLREYELFKTKLVDSVSPILKIHIAGVIAVCENKVNSQ